MSLHVLSFPDLLIKLSLQRSWLECIHTQDAVESYDQNRFFRDFHPPSDFCVIFLVTGISSKGDLRVA